MATLDLAAVLACLRAIEWPCAPPIGVGEFDVLYVSEAEVVVWYTPAREGQRTGEVAVPCARLAAVWQRLRTGATLDEAALIEACGGEGKARWVLALLALVPGVRVRQEPLALSLSPDEAVEGEVAVTSAPAKARSRRRRAARG